MKIDLTDTPLAPNESRGARNFLGLSQAQAAEKSNLPAHKLKRFEAGNYVPDSQFLQDLRAFFEGEGYNFNDEKTPGAKARANGDVFPAGVVGESGGDTGETDGSPSIEPGKPQRPVKANVQFMRIAQSLENDQIDQVFNCIEENEAAILESLEKPVIPAFLGDGPSNTSQAQAIALLRRLAENGLMYARLMGRDLLSVTDQDEGKKQAAASRRGLFVTTTQVNGSWKTVGDLLCAAMTDAQLAVIDGNKEAQARRKSRTEPTEVLQALVG